ncbi:MAG: hypothetical protein F6K53_20190 [Moorea sp. SIO4A1]|uniref:hypothetical protein n=1 Tax=Moorena sp. SIO4A1 TaxID=2607835 RepID=UPI001417A609|nr:hypothetical protein [Moorena sp. SIO4A1]NEO43278.1 hypothetical protein [Moorena sp. SIO4A3]NEQ59592.1 hypothetical protein [Moorena sp. SIO4A1]
MISCAIVETVKKRTIIVDILEAKIRFRFPNYTTPVMAIKYTPGQIHWHMYKKGDVISFDDTMTELLTWRERVAEFPIPVDKPYLVTKVSHRHEISAQIGQKSALLLNALTVTTIHLQEAK